MLNELAPGLCRCCWNYIETDTGYGFIFRQGSFLFYSSNFTNNNGDQIQFSSNLFCFVQEQWQSIGTSSTLKLMIITDTERLARHE